jgi:YHS domain-containing protein
METRESKRRKKNRRPKRLPRVSKSEAHMNRKILIVCVALIVALTLGCSKDKSKEEAKKEKVQQARTSKIEKGKAVKVPKLSYIIDPVSGNPVDVNKVPYNFVYKDVRYHFESKENMETFKKDPEKYLKKK